MTLTRGGSPPSARGPASWCTGTVRIDAPFQGEAPARVGGAPVAVEPGARTAWHTPAFGQTRRVTFGRVTFSHGRAPRAGGPVEELRPGDVVWFAPHETHGHGGGATTAMRSCSRT